MTDTPVDASSFKDCRTACNANAQCAVWSYLPSVRKCYLKNLLVISGSSENTKESVDGAISGRKDCVVSGEDSNNACLVPGVKLNSSESVLVSSEQHE